MTSRMVNRMMTSECWSIFVCSLLHAQHKKLANIVFSCLIHVIMKMMMKLHESVSSRSYYRLLK